MKKILLIAAVSAALCTTATLAQTQKRAIAPGAMSAPAATTTIYKLVDDSGRITYSNLPLKGATVVDLEPLTVIPASVRATAAPATPQISGQSNININTAEGSNSLPASAALASTSSIAAAVVSTAIPSVALAPPSSLPNVDTSTQKRRDDMRRKILEDEMRAEEKQLADAVIALNAHESDRTVINLMRSAAEKGTPAAYAEARRNYDLREEKLKSFQESITNHEKNVGALKKELAALK